MKGDFSLTGVAVSLNTPFNSANHIDFDSLARLIEMHLRGGASGFLAPAQAGEVNELTVSERIEVIQFVQQSVGDRATFIAGVTSPDAKDACIIAEAAVRAGCGAVLAEIPEQYRCERASALKFCREIAQTGVPALVIQDLDWIGPGLDVSWIVEMFETLESFQCIKIEVRPAGPKYTAVREATGGKLSIAGGWAADQIIEALDRGVDICMPTAMTRHYADIVRHYWSGDRDGAIARFREILPVLAFTRQHLDISIQFYKRLMVHRGIFQTTNIRKECILYDRFHERYGEEMISYLDQLESSHDYQRR